MSRRGLYGHKVALCDVKSSGIAVISFAGIFELYLNDVEVSISSGDIIKPVVAVKFSSRRFPARVASARCRCMCRHRMRLFGCNLRLLLCRSRRLSVAICDMSLDGIFLRCCGYVFVIGVHYFAKLTERVSRITVILTCPGYVISVWMRLAISAESFSVSASSILSAPTITRSSRPA
ncbi:hypothetical protein IMSAG192_00745 [Muribaculaceae bacterium]|nr:hypothetical protein IMSAG192_00745 [Muribaculaceae bacterium]